MFIQRYSKRNNNNNNEIGTFMYFSSQSEFRINRTEQNTMEETIIMFSVQKTIAKKNGADKWIAKSAGESSAN